MAMLEPSVRMRDRWHERPMFGLLFLLAFLAFFWWGQEHETATIGQLLIVSILFASLWMGRDHTLTKRIASLTEAVEHLALVVQANSSARAASEVGGLNRPQ